MHLCTVNHFGNLAASFNFLLSVSKVDFIEHCRAVVCLQLILPLSLHFLPTFFSVFSNLPHELLKAFILFCRLYGMVELLSVFSGMIECLYESCLVHRLLHEGEFKMCQVGKLFLHVLVNSDW